MCCSQSSDGQAKPTTGHSTRAKVRLDVEASFGSKWVRCNLKVRGEYSIANNGRIPAQNDDTQPHEVAAEPGLELCKARESDIEARHKLEEATKLAGDLRKQLEEARKCIAELDQNRDIAAAATNLLQEENLKLKAELADTKSKLADTQKRAATEENTESLKARIESLKVSLANAAQ